MIESHEVKRRTGIERSAYSDFKVIVFSCFSINKSFGKEFSCPRVDGKWKVCRVESNWEGIQV